jgi:DNA-binding CsgD family transcriptional regulator
MNHFIFILLFFVFVSLTAWTSIVFLLFRNAKKSVLGWETAIASSLMAIIGGLLVYYYGRNCDLATGVLPTAICFAGTLSVQAFLPFFTFSLLCISPARSLRLFFRIITVFYASALCFIPQTVQYNIVGPFAGNAPNTAILAAFIVYGSIFYGTLGYCFYLGFAKGKTIGDKSLRRLRTGTFGTAFLFLPFLVLFSAMGNQDVAVMCLSLMFLVLAITNLYHSVFFSKQPVYRTGNDLTDQFIRKFRISEREKEVIQLLLGGKANKDIADALFISVRTVENHLSNIYQKTETTGRVQVINLIRAHAV